jgi:release factor glutamine methyltransferase
VSLSLQDRLEAKNPNYKDLIAKGYPVDYILEQVNILGLEFKINKNILIPRPETEWLIQLLNNYFDGKKVEELKDAVEFLTPFQKTLNRSLVVDIGTGSGLIALGLSQNFTHVLATDKYLKALKVAAGNARLNNITNIEFVQSDLLLSPVVLKQLKRSNNALLIANLPYVPDSDLDKAFENRVNFEPKTAIYSGQDGLKHYKRLLNQLKRFKLKPRLSIFELDPRNIQKAFNLGKKYFNQQIIVNDYNDMPRFLFCASI